MLSTTDPHFNSTEEKAIDALNFIIPIISKYGFKWVITGGFASYVHGVKRSITDIDIDIFASKEDSNFKKFISEIASYSEDGLEHNQDGQYDNYSIDLDIKGQIVDICPTEDLYIFSKEEKHFIHLPFYTEDFAPKIKPFHELELPLLPIAMIIQNKEMIQREIDLLDLPKLKALLKDDLKL